MKHLKFSMIWLTVLLSCGTPEPYDDLGIGDLRTLCDGRDELVLLIKTTPIRDSFVLGAIWNENGNRFIHLNGKCEFWVWADLDPFSGLWASGSYVETGTLTDEQGLDFLDMLLFKKWSEADETWFSAGLPNTKIEYFSHSAKFAFSGRDDSTEGLFRGELNDGFRDALEFLLEIGEPVEQEQLRLQIVPGADARLRDDLNSTYFVNWDYHLTVEEFAAKQSPYCFGDSILLTGNDALQFKGEREAWLKASESNFGLFIALKSTAGDSAYYFLLRDVSPYEDNNGLVVFPGLDPVVECFPTE